MLSLIQSPGWQGWVASVPPFLLLGWILWRNPFGGWRRYYWWVAALVAISVAGALWVDFEDGARSLFLTFLWAISRISLLYAAVSVFAALYPNKPLTPNVVNLTLVVLAAFVLALVVDPMLALMAVLYLILRPRGPAISVVAATIATLLGSALLSGLGPFGAFVKASSVSVLGIQLLWTPSQVRLTIVTMLAVLLLLHALGVWIWRRRHRPSKSRAVSFWQWFQPKNQPGTHWVLAGFVVLVVAGKYLPNINDQLAEALWYILQGQYYRISESWWQLVPWREISYFTIGLAAQFWLRPAQQKNNFGFAPLLAAAWVLLLLHLAAAPFMTVLFTQRDQWPTLLQVAYELLRWIRGFWPERWQLQLMALGVTFALALVPSFPALALIAHDGRLNGDRVKWRGRVTKLSPYGAVRRAFWFVWPSLLVGVLVTKFLLG